MTKISFIGTGAALNSRTAKTCFLLDDSTLIDAGSDPVPPLKRLGIDPNEIREVLITHLHGDHYFGVAFLIAEAMVGPKPRLPLHIIGPGGLENSVRALLALAYPLTSPDVFLERANVAFQEVRPGDQIQTDRYTGNVVDMDHGRMPALGFAIEAKSTTVLFTGDGRPGPAMVAALAEAQHWVVNTPTRQEPLDAHASLDTYLDLIDPSVPPKRVFVCHRTFDEVPSETIRFPMDEEVYVLEPLE